MKFPLFAGLIGLAYCAENDINGPGNVVISGKDNKIDGKFNTLKGFTNLIKGNFNDIEGDKNKVNGDENQVEGHGNLVIGSGNFVIGQGNNVVDQNVSENWSFDNISLKGMKDWKKNMDPKIEKDFQYVEQSVQKLAGDLKNKIASNIQQRMSENIKKSLQERFKQQMPSFDNGAFNQLKNRMKHANKKM